MQIGLSSDIEPYLTVSNPIQQYPINFVDVDRIIVEYWWIQILVFLQNLSINDDVVKTYRNYVILYSLSSVIEEASICVSGI